jgi:hypothetical protein
MERLIKQAGTGRHMEHNVRFTKGTTTQQAPSCASTAYSGPLLSHSQQHNYTLPSIRHSVTLEIALT